MAKPTIPCSRSHNDPMGFLMRIAKSAREIYTSTIQSVSIRTGVVSREVAIEFHDVEHGLWGSLQEPS
jgi:hypothetical protein